MQTIHEIYASVSAQEGAPAPPASQNPPANPQSQAAHAHGYMSDWLENRLIDFIFRAQPYTLPDNLYVALYATPIADDFGAAGASPPEELSGEGYARAVIPRSPLAWAGTQGVGFTEPTEPSWGTTGRTSNNVPIQFPAATGDWGTALWWAIHDAPTGGNMLYYGELLYPRTIYPGDVPVSFGPGDMAVWIDP